MSESVIKRGLSDWPDIVLSFIPLLDREYADLIAMMPVLRYLTTWIPGVHPIYLSEEPAIWVKNFLLNLGFTSDDWLLGTLTGGIGLLLPLDKEAFRWVLYTFDLDFMEGFFNQKSGPSQQGSYVNENGEIVMADGGVRRRNNGGGSGGSGSAIKKLLMIGGPIMIVMFLLGSGYADLATNQLGFQAGGIDMPAIGASIAQAAKTLECVGNVACVRQWQFNNTQRPGSEEVGQEYKLEIENFNVNDGFPLDVANRRAGDRVPVDFSVYNPRHGLKGIEARNVAYRIAVYDNVGSLLNDPKCQTGWLPLGGEYADDNDFGQNGTILPGGFATPLGTHSELTLRDCGLLQPALGINRRVRLQLAYDYSSQSTLQVQAMSRQNMLSLEQRPSFKKSQTADTPVKTYINVESPITYRINDTGGAESSIFGLRVGFETGQRNIKYRVHPNGFKLYDSSETADVNNADGFDDIDAISCEDLELQQNNQYDFSSNMTDYLNNRQASGWFKSNAGPSPARCSMVLENPETISPTGETLTFRIDANYTVLLEEIVGGFRVQNSQCTQFECPLLVPQSHHEVENGNLYSRCESSISLDANDGCGARFGDDWVDTADDYAINNNVDSIIEEGETAYSLTKLLDDLPGYVESSFTSREYIIGLEEQLVQDLGTENYAALTTVETNDGQDVEYKEVSKVLCSNDDVSQTEFREMWDSKNPGDLIYFNQPPPQNCAEEDLADFVLELYTWSLYESPEEEYNKINSGCEGAVVISESGLECYS